MSRMCTSPLNNMATGESPCGMAKSGRPRESLVWDYFVYKEEKKKSICLEQEEGPCNLEIAGKYLKNLKAHLRAKHPRELAELASKDAKAKELKRKKSQEGSGPSFSVTQLTIVDAVARMKTYTNESEWYKRITKKLATFVTVGNVANRIVE